MIHSTLRPGIFSLPGATHSTKKLTQEQLQRDFAAHHGYTNTRGFHNHLSHHILAAYDLGAPASLLEAIYEKEEQDQRPIHPNDLEDKEEPKIPDIGEVNESNWTTWLGRQLAYAAYLDFFAKEVIANGSVATIEKYIFSPAANGEHARMLIRLVSGALHPFIHIGYGVEFSEDLLVAQGLAIAAIHSPSAVEVFSEQWPHDIAATALPSSGQAPTLLSLLREVYDADTLVPKMPYDPDALLAQRIHDALAEGRGAELKRIVSQWTVDEQGREDSWDHLTEQCIWLATLLLAATGRKGREPRLDFFLMHCVTSSIFLPSFIKVLSPTSKRYLLSTYARVIFVYVMARGRPRIDIDLVVSYDEHPHPPNMPELPQPDKKTIGDPRLLEGTNPWPAIISAALHCPDSHTVKTIRSLAYAAHRYGTTPPGDVIGAFGASGKETHEGVAKLDGSVFVRATGVVMQKLGWVSWGQENGGWDYSGLGWDDAWEKE